ncbi:hypothetical protein J4409_01580 [Candidatus Woesearchaeota archaeon]|nr:hypothetical protein [Candidatus Woesearchaeota archaeon]
MDFKVKRVDKYLFAIALFLISFIVLYFLSSYTGFVTYPRQGYIEGGIFGGFLPGFGGLFELYYEYAQWFDFFIFLLIFLGLGKFAFGSHFKEGGKAIYVGLGIFLALALVLWEARTGIVLIEMFGPLIPVFLAVLVFFVMYKYLKGNISGGGLLLLSIGYILAYVIFIWLDAFSFMAWYYSSPLYYNIPFDLIPIASILFALAWIGFFVGLIIKWKK